MPLSASRGGCLSALTILLVWLQCISVSLAIKGDSGCKGSLCVTATADGDVVTYEMTGGVQRIGWVAIGFGKRMIDTHMVIMWQNDDGSTTLSQRFADGYTMPQPVSQPPRIATPTEPKQAVPGVAYPADWKTLAFQVPANKSLLASANAKESLIFAYSPTRPDKDPNSLLTRHEQVGHITVDLGKEFVATVVTAPPRPSPKPHGTLYTGSNLAYKRVEKLIILHGFLVSLGFLVVLPAGSLIGRWGRNFTPKWFKAHMISNFVVALPVITIGVLLGPVVVYNKESFRSHFINGHEIYGALLLFAYYAQGFLGRYIHHHRLALAQLGPITKNHPVLNIAHIVLGVSIITLAFFQVRTGLEWWEALTGRGPITSWALPLWKAWIVILPVAYFSGYALLPRQLRQEQVAAYAPIAAGASEERSQTDRLLAEEEEAS